MSRGQRRQRVPGRPVTSKQSSSSSHSQDKAPPLPNHAVAELAALTVQRESEHSQGAGPLDPAVAAEIQRASGGGQPLPEGTQSQMEDLVGTDLSGVRVHTDTTADRLSRSVRARAFTAGSDVFFATSEYNPDSTTGQRLLAHELTHVAQQADGRVGEPGTVSHPDDPLEREAHERADAFDASSASTSAKRPPSQTTGQQVQRAVLAPTHTAARGEGGQAWVRPGDQGPHVAEIRDLLNTIGTAGTPLAAGDRYDAAMVEVIRQFQADAGIGVDSLIGPLTHEALDRHRTNSEESVGDGRDHIGSADRPTDAELSAINATLNPTTAGGGGVAQDWDGRNDPAARRVLRDDLLAAMQQHLDDATPGMKRMEAAKAAGQVLQVRDREGAGRAAKADVDVVFGDLTSAAVLTRPQAHARSAFNFSAGRNLLDASDRRVRRPDPFDLAEWIAETDGDARRVKTAHHFDHDRRGQGEPGFFRRIRNAFVRRGSNRSDLARYDRFGFAFAQSGPRVLSQVAVLGQRGFSATPSAPGAMSDAERLERWRTWSLLVHEYIHTLEHPNFHAANGGNRILVEGFCELFTREVLERHGAILSAQVDLDPARRIAVEGGDLPGFEARFVEDYDAGAYTDYLAGADEVVAQVGMDAVRAAFFLGHVELIGLVPRGDADVIDPTDVVEAAHLMPERVVVPDEITTVNGVSILTGAETADIVGANPGLDPAVALPPESHTTGLVVPGTRHHRVLTVRGRGQRTTETKAQIAAQHGVTLDALVRANPSLNHREPREGQWILIPKH